MRFRNMKLVLISISNCPIILLKIDAEDEAELDS